MTSKHGTRVTNLPDLVAISLDKRSMLEMSASKMAFCHDRHLITKSDKFPHKSMSQPSCASAMFLKRGIKEHCQFEFQESIITPSLTELDEATLLLTNIDEIIFTCNQHVHKQNGCSFCIIGIPGFCSISAGPFRFSPKLAACQDTTKMSM